MKAIIAKSDLYEHKKVLKTAKPVKSLLGSTLLTMTVSNRFLVVGPGFEHSVECEAVEWGTITVPYITWDRLLQSLKFVSGGTVTFAASDGQIGLDTLKINHPDIKVSSRDKIPLELPINPTPLDIMKLLSLHEIEQLETSGMWNNIREAKERLRGQIIHAANTLGEYGVNKEDLASQVCKRLEIKNREIFMRNLFGKLNK